MFREVLNTKTSLILNKLKIHISNNCSFFSGSTLLEAKILLTIVYQRQQVSFLSLDLI